MKTLELKYLLPLLDDTDEEVYGAVKQKIIQSGPANISLLEEALSTADTLLQHERIESLIMQLKMLQLKDRLLNWIRSDAKSLQEGWILISSIQGNEISPVNIEKLIQQITRKIWLEMNQHQTSFEKIAHFNRIFFEFYGFRINYGDVPSVEDNYLDKILILRHGNPLSLNILYAIFARKLNLPLVPISIQHKIFLGYYDPVLSREAFIDNVHPFLFFIDLEHKGKIIGVKEFDYLMKEHQLTWSAEMSINNTEMIKRLLIRIKGIYTYLKEQDKRFLADDLLKFFEH
jgi:regulator of sirC expression with transglutaminase-like and TPR domain